MNWQVIVRMQLGALKLNVDIQGEHRPVAIIGPNGCGKTTLLRIIAGAYQPDAGKIRLGDRILFDSQSQLSLPPEERNIGYVPQGYRLFPHLNVLDNVAFGYISRKTKSARKEAATTFLDQLGCAHLALRLPSELSGGEQQKVALARALITNPDFLLLDEPLAALDTSARRSLRHYLADHLEKRNSPTLVVTHDMRDVLALNATVYAFEDGNVVQHGPAEALATEPRTEFIAEFFHSEQRIENRP